MVPSRLFAENLSDYRATFVRGRTENQKRLFKIGENQQNSTISSRNSLLKIHSTKKGRHREKKGQHMPPVLWHGRVCAGSPRSLGCIERERERERARARERCERETPGYESLYQARERQQEPLDRRGNDYQEAWAASSQASKSVPRRRGTQRQGPRHRPI